jgi:raffinose/stachyose/melibiose transport system permease protein
LPALALYAVFVLIPIVQGAWLSFWKWDGITAAVWAGWSNYTDILTDPDLRNAFVHSLLLVPFYTVLPMSIGLLLAAFATRPRVKGIPFARTVMFLPQIVPLIAVGFVWSWIFQPDGPLNQGLRALGLGGLAIGWLGHTPSAFIAIGVVAIWVTSGYCFVLFLVGIQNIPGELFDAAKIDGANAWQEFWTVTFPGIRNEIVVTFIITMIGALQTFDLVYLLTQGGPGSETAVPAWQIYRRAFFYGEVGSSSALGVVLGVIILILTLLFNRPRTER